MNKAYNRIVWENYPSEQTPINEENLNKMDLAVDEIDNRVITVDTTKLNKTSASGMIVGFSLDSETGIITLNYFDGSSKTINTNLSKVAINVSYDYENERLVLAMPDGAETYVDMSALITEYEFVESDTVSFVVSTDGNVSAIVKEGSIEEKHLRPNYLADIRVETATSAQNADRAEIAATRAEEAADRAEEVTDTEAIIEDIKELKESVLQISTDLGGKQDAITGAITTVLSSDLSANKVLVSNSDGKLMASSVSSTELGYLAGVTSAIQPRLTELEKLVNGDTPKIITVGSSGCRFTKINDAIAFAKTYCSTSNRVTIFIAQGTYNEQIVLLDNPGIDLIGCGWDNTVIRYDGTYPNCVINTTGRGMFKDLQIRNDNNTTYAIHSENGESGLSGNLVFENCFIYGGTHAVGVGLGQGENFFLNNCILYSKSNAPIYFHNAAYENVTNQNMRVHNCRLYCTTSSVKYGVLIDDAAYSYGITTGVTYVEFINTHYRQGNQILFRRNTNDSSIDINYINVSNSRFRVTLNSSGNNMLGLNYDNREVNITQYVTKPTQSSSGTNYFEYSIFYPHADKYKWYVTGATLPGVGDITSNLSIQNTSENSINLKDTNTGGAGYSISVTLKGTVK